MEKALAQLRNPVLPPGLGGGTAPSVGAGGETLGRIIGGVLGMIFIIAFILSFVYLMVGGVRWITSGSDKASLESARNTIVQALVGMVIVGAGWAVASLVGQFLGLDIKSLPIPVIPSL
jgi:hypothetical protein